jgi:3'-5' exoribonuclease
MKNQYIESLKENMKVDSFFAVRQFDFKSYRPESGKKGQFLVLTLTDRTGEIQCVLFDNAESLKDRISHGCVVRVTGHSNLFRGNLQIQGISIEPINEGSYDIGDFLPVSPRNPEQMQEELFALIQTIKNKELRSFLSTQFGEKGFSESFFRAPAAIQIHHGYLHGLLEHSIETAQMGLSIGKYHPMIDNDILIAGGILHDIGKLEEYEYGTVIGMTDIGKLEGHLVLGRDILLRSAEKLGISTNTDWVRHIAHVILSHHGNLEWGAVVVPQTLEAHVIHLADLQSGRANQIVKDIETSMDENDWTEYDRFLESKIYKGFMRK